jgi:chromate reductase
MSKIAVIVGSLRKESYSRKIAKYVCGLLPEDFEITFCELSDVDMFDQDLDDEGRTPTSWTRLRGEIAGADGVLFVTPEYNRSFPAVLKNALDICSRPPGQSLWAEKKAAVIGATPSNMFAANSVYGLKATMAFLDIRLMNSPEQLIAGVHEILGEDGSVTNEHKQKSLQTYADAFAAWVDGE